MRTFVLLLAFLVAGTSIYSVLPIEHVSAQTVDQLQSNVSDLSAKIKALDAEIASYNSKILSTQGEAKTLKQALANLEYQRSLLSKEISRTLLKIKAAQSKIADTQVEITVTQLTIDKNKNAIMELMRTLYRNESSEPPLLSTLSKTGKLSDTLDAVKRNTDISNTINTKVQNLKDSKDDLQVTKSAYEESKKQLETLTENLSDQKASIEQTSSQKAQLLALTKNKETEYQKLLQERKAKKGQLEQELLDVESKLKVFVDANKLPRYGSGVLKWPISTVKITQTFGNTPFASQNPQVYNGSGHNGVDFGASVGTPILAAESGIVVGTGNTDASCVGVSYGKWVLIKHSNGLTTLYAHLSRIDVVGGQSVTALQKIGLSGNTGYSTGPHLHFTVYASDSVHISGPTEYKSKVCGTYMIMPLAPRAGYLNPLSYL
jgi:murein DD-endopeptidase MepM/ murein hydrolase activator NlpD